MDTVKFAGSMLFLSTLSLRRATVAASTSDVSANISIHALLAESDTCIRDTALLSIHFYPRSPCGERQFACAGRFKIVYNFYPRSPCGERQYLVHGQRPNWGISIHALLAESDWNSHQATVHTWKFLSTLSLRRATESQQLSARPTTNFYPRSPCGERH